MKMNDENGRTLLLFLAGLAIAMTVVLAVLYARQRLFTRTEPIILVS